MIMIIEYELHCSCGVVKHEKTRHDILVWWLDHNKAGDHNIKKLLWFLNKKCRELGEQEIQEFIDFIKSGKPKESDPWGLPGLGHGVPGRRGE